MRGVVCIEGLGDVLLGCPLELRLGLGRLWVEERRRVVRGSVGQRTVKGVRGLSVGTWGKLEGPGKARKVWGSGSVRVILVCHRWGQRCQHGWI